MQKLHVILNCGTALPSDVNAYITEIINASTSATPSLLTVFGSLHQGRALLDQARAVADKRAESCRSLASLTDILTVLNTLNESAVNHDIQD